MAFNIMDLIQSSLTSDNVGAVAGALNLDNALVKKGLMAAIPAVLAAVLGGARKPEGREALDSAMDAVDDDMLGKLGSMLTGDGKSSLIAMGGGLLTSFLGDQKRGQLGGALSSSLGISKENGGALLGIATPLLMSLLKVRKKTEGLDTGGLVDTLFSQKDQIAKAIPDDIGGQLQGAGIFDDLLGSAGATAARAGAATQAAAASTVRAMDSAQRATGRAVEQSSSSWLKWVIIALVVLGLLYFLSGGLKREEAPVVGGGAISMDDLTVGGVNLGTSVKDLMGDFSSSLASITDASSARAAMSDLDAVSSRLGSIEAAVGQLPPAGRSALASVVNASLPSIEASAERVLGDGAVASVVKPLVDDILGRLSAIARS